MANRKESTAEFEDDGSYFGDEDHAGNDSEFDDHMHSMSQSVQREHGVSFRDTTFSLGAGQRHVSFSHGGDPHYSYGSYSTSYKPDSSIPEGGNTNVSEKSRLVGGRSKSAYPTSKGTTSSFSQGQSAFMSSIYKMQNTMSTTIHAIGQMNSTLAMQRTFAFTWSLADIPSFDRSASTFLTCFNSLSMIQGISMLAMPFIIVKGGIINVILIVLLGLLSWYGTILLVKCQYQTSKRPPRLKKRIYASYIEIGAGAFPRYGETIFKMLTISGVVTDVYCFVLLGQMTSDLFPNDSSPFTSQIWILIWAAAALPTFFITKVSILSWLGFVALIAYTIALITSYVYLFSQASIWSTDNIPLMPSIQYITIAYGVILNSYNFHQSVPAIEGSMKYPSSATKMLTAAFSINIIMKILFGVAGALTFGILVDQSVTRNLSANLIVAFIVNVLTAINLFFNAPMSLFVVFEMIDRYSAPYFTIFKKGKPSFWGWIILSRLIVMLLIVFVSVSVSQFGLIVSFIGNIRGTLVSIVFPITFYLSLFWRHLSKLSVVFHILLMAICVIVGIGGSYYSLMGIAVGA